MHAEKIMSSPPEPVIIHAGAPELSAVHLLCAVHEHPLSTDTAVSNYGESALDQLRSWASENPPRVMWEESSQTWVSCGGGGVFCSGHRTSLRTIEDTVITVIRTDTLQEIDSLPLSRVCMYREQSLV